MKTLFWKTTLKDLVDNVAQFKFYLLIGCYGLIHQYTRIFYAGFVDE